MDFASSVLVRLKSTRALLVVTAIVALVVRAEAQQEVSPVVAKSPDNVAAGAIDQAVAWDLSATDCTYKVDRKEVWIVDSHSQDEPFVLRFQADDLANTPPSSVRLVLPPDLAGIKVLGIAEIPHGSFKGLNFVLVDTTYGSNEPGDPQIGVFRDDGAMVDGVPFTGVLGVDPTARLTSISVNPEPGIEEIAAYDSENHAFYVLDFFFSVVRGPTPCLGFSHFFAQPWQFGPSVRGMGMGITYNGPDTVLVTAGFFNLFETRFALEYDAAAGSGYTGRALDLSAASAEGAIDLVFAGLAAGLVADEDVVFALNVSDESLYAFTPAYEDQPEPVSLDPAGCFTDPATGQYTISWEVSPAAFVDSVIVFENGVQVATLPPDATEYQSPLPLVGKVFVEVATEANGVVSGVRQTCQLENTRTPRLPGVTVDASVLNGDFVYGDIAVTKRPATPEEFRLYVHVEPSSVGTFDHTLNLVDGGGYGLTEPRSETSLPRQDIGLTLAPLAGKTHLAVLDPNGFNDDGFASVAFYPLEGDRGVAARVVDTVDMTELPETLALHNWDHVDDEGDGYYVASGTFIDGVAPNEVLRFVLVRLDFSANLFVGTRMVHIPQREMTPFIDEPIVGIAVSALPSGHLMVAGGRPFLDSYSEVILATRFGLDEATAARFVGYAQGLPVSGQFFGYGNDIGPRRLDGLATAYFAPAEAGATGIGVTYHTAERPVLVSNPNGFFLTSGFKLAIHSENEVSSPGLAAEQLLESGILLQAGQTRSSETVSASFANDVPSMDYYITIVNLEGFVTVPAVIDVLLDGTRVPEATQEVVLGPGMNLRIRLPERSEKKCQVQLTNNHDDVVELRVIIGAITDLGDEVVPEGPRFRRGDCNGDGGVQIADAGFGLGALFQGNDQPPCLDACDLDDNGAFNIGDMIGVLSFLFQGGAEPLPPGPDTCGVDPSDDGLAVCVYSACR